MLSHKDRVKQAVTTGGTGNLVIGAASTGYQALAGGDNALIFPYVIEDSNDWETGYGTYTHGGTVFARTIRKASSTGAALNVTTNAFLYVDFIAAIAAGLSSAQQSAITGLLITRSSATAIAISAGSYYDPTVHGMVDYAGGTLSPTLSASAWHSVYIVNGTPEAFAEDPPSSAYFGTARKRATGNAGRYIGSFKTDASSEVIAQNAIESGANQVLIAYSAAIGSAPFVVVSNDGTGTLTSRTLVGSIPRYVASEALLVSLIGAATSLAEAYVFFGLDATNYIVSQEYYIRAGGSYIQNTVWSPINPSTPNIFTSINMITGTGPSLYVYNSGYKFAR